MCLLLALFSDEHAKRAARILITSLYVTKVFVLVANVFSLASVYGRHENLTEVSPVRRRADVLRDPPCMWACTAFPEAVYVHPTPRHFWWGNVAPNP